MSDFKQAPIVHVVFSDGQCRYSQVFSPGLPDGSYDLYVEPRDDLLRAAYMRGRTDEAALNSIPQKDATATKGEKG